MKYTVLTTLLFALIPNVTAANEPTGVVTGTLAYEADAERPWRYARYYVKKGRLAEAVVEITGRPVEDADRKPVTHVMDQKDFRFVPETLAIRAGDRVKFTNSDDQIHNVFTSDLSPFNVNTPPGEPHTREFPKAGGTAKPVRLGCIYHSNMRAWIFVLDHPRHALTGADGVFRIEGVPPGRHTLAIAHPAGRLSRTVDFTVTAGKTTDVGSVTLTPDDLPRRKPSTRKAQP